MKLEFSRQIFEKHPNIKFHENLFNGSRVVPWGRADGQTDRTKLTVTFRNFASAPKIIHRCLNENVGSVLLTLRTFKILAADIHVHTAYRLVQKGWPSSILHCIGFKRNTIGLNTGMSKKARRFGFHEKREFFVQESKLQLLTQV